MNRKLTKTLVNENSVEAKLFITFPKTPFDAENQYRVIRQLSENPFITHCCGRLAQSVSISYNGEAFVVECKALVPRSEADSVNP